MRRPLEDHVVIDKRALDGRDATQPRPAEVKVEPLPKRFERIAYLAHRAAIGRAPVEHVYGLCHVQSVPSRKGGVAFMSASNSTARANARLGESERAGEEPELGFVDAEVLAPEFPK